MDLTKPTSRQKHEIPPPQHHQQQILANRDLSTNHVNDNAASSQPIASFGAQDGELVDGLEWKDGIGTLRGCEDLKFRMNASGDVELMTEDLSNANGSTMHHVTSNGLCDIKTEVLEPKEERFEGSETNATNMENIEVMNVRSDAAQIRCPVCGVYGASTEFRGRFCSKKCVAKNANQHRAISMRLKRELSQTSGHASLSESPSVISSEGNQKSKDLKIRIRLSSSPPLQRGENVTKRRPSSLVTGLHPTDGRKRHFLWSNYTSEDGVLAPASAFQILTGKNPLPGINQFKLGMALEGVDPVHQSLICPLSVTAIKGFRVRLHICGYSESYDFWTNADSPLIFPCGFCEKTGRKLEPPKGYLSENFNWEKYMKKFRLYAAPDVIFSVISEEKDCSFKPEEKLEAIDKHNPDLICVATIGDVIGENILIHFDGWTHDFDYWCTSSSRLIHPVNWCKNENKTLTPPEGYPQAEFTWSVYLSECGAKAASEDSFSPAVPHGLETGMKLEAVDLRNPILIRVATILAINDYRIYIHFDGWSDVYDFWADLESPDIHPPGWCEQAGYPLQPPLTEADLISVPGQGGCPVPGCIGVGHIRGSKFVGHHSEFGCPYSQQNLHKQYLHDRLSRSRLSTSTQDAFKSGSDGENGSDQVRPAKIRRTRKSLVADKPVNSPGDYTIGEKSTPPPIDSDKKTVVSSSEMDTLIDEHGKSHYSSTNHSVFISALSSFPNYDLPLCWDQHSKILPSVKGITVSELSKWSVSDVSRFVSDLTERPEYGKIFATEEIDGEAMLLLTQMDIAKVLNIKLGSAIKIYNAILLVKAAEHLPV